MEKITASKLFSGTKHVTGKQRCFFCSADCDESYLSADCVKDTFTNRDIVKCPGSLYVCRGCVDSLGWGEDEMLMLDGTLKQRSNDKGMAPRMYSWLITKYKKWAFTKAHISLIREMILHEPPEPPFSIVFADSGQKHLIFRAPVAMSKKEFPVMLEEEIINVKPEELRDRLALALPVAAAIGKPVLLEEPTFSMFITYEKYHGDTAGLEAWQEVRQQPISRLAAWLSKSKEDAQHECPKNEPGRVPEENGGAGRSLKGTAGNGTGCSKRRGGQAVLDFG